MGDVLQDLERLIRRDPAGRGLIASEPQFGPLCPGHLQAAAEHLAERGERVGVVTGFYIPGGETPACETDGPPGAVLLAVVLERLGLEAFVVTDDLCAGTIHAAAEFCGFTEDRVVLSGDGSEDWLQEVSLSHLIAVERVGPCHTDESIRRQYPQDSAVVEEFLREVPAEHRGRCHNMRGVVIDEFTHPLHLLFEEFAATASQGKTIGVGDGGNEIGMGGVPWRDLRRRLSGDFAGRVPSRIPTDWTILAGVSNWGALALAAAVAVLKGRIDVLQPFDGDHHERLLQHIVKHGPAVDGVTGRREPTVDGLPFVTYIQPWLGIRRELGLAE